MIIALPHQRRGGGGGGGGGHSKERGKADGSLGCTCSGEARVGHSAPGVTMEGLSRIPSNMTFWSAMYLKVCAHTSEATSRVLQDRQQSQHIYLLESADAAKTAEVETPPFPPPSNTGQLGNQRSVPTPRRRPPVHTPAQRLHPLWSADVADTAEIQGTRPASDNLPEQPVQKAGH